MGCRFWQPLISLANPTLDDVWRLFQETDHRFQETERVILDIDRLVINDGALVGVECKSKLIEECQVPGVVC